MQAQPGWYPDPSGADGERYFDGTDWTDRRAVTAVRKRRLWPWIVAGVLVLFFGLCGTAFVVGSHWGMWTDRVRAVRDGQLEFVLTDFSKAELQDSPRPAGEYVLASVTVIDTGTEAHSFSVQNQQLIDATGRKYPAMGMVAETAWKHEVTTVDVKPGTSLKVVLRFDGPKATKLEAVEFHDSPSSAGARFNL